MPNGSKVDARAARGVSDNTETMRAWRLPALVLFAALAVVTIIAWEAVSAAVTVWYLDTSFNHGFAILPVVVYLLWNQRADWLSLVPAPTAWGVVFVAGASALWFLGAITHTQVVQQFAYIGLVQSLVLTVLGWRIVKVMAFPLFFLFFAIPVGTSLHLPLQILTAHFATEALRFIGIPVYLEGLFISIPTGVFEVAQVCSGLRFLTATVALSVLCMHLLMRQWWRRILFLALSVIVPIVANGFRAFGIVLLAHLTDHEIAVGVDHIVYGWVFFSLVTAIMLVIAWKLRDRGIATPGDSDRGPPTAPLSWAGPARVVGAGIAAVVLPVAAAAWATNAMHGEAEVGAVALPDVPMGAPWQEISSAQRGWTPVFPGAHLQAFHTFSDGQHTVDRFIAYYVRQNQDAELIAWNNRIAGSPDWREVSSRRSHAKIGGQTVDVRAVRLISPGSRRAAWVLYWVDGDFTASPHIAKLLRARSIVMAGSDAAAAIIVSAEYTDSPAEAETALGAFLAELGSLKADLVRVAER